MVSLKDKSTNALPTPKFEINVQYIGGETEALDYPSEDVEILANGIDEAAFYPEAFHVGDVVEALFGDGIQSGKWFLGNISNVNADGNSCDVQYFDGDVSCLFCLSFP